MNENQTITRAEIEYEVLEQITEELREAIDLHSPESWPQERRDALGESMLTESQRVLDALSTNELRSAGGLRSHIAQAVAETKRWIHSGGVPRREP